jgi:hypothetical protein
MINGFGTRGWLMTAFSTVWTGSVVRDHDHRRMFYTAISNAGHHTSTNGSAQPSLMIFIIGSG